MAVQTTHIIENVSNSFDLLSDKEQPESILTELSSILSRTKSNAVKDLKITKKIKSHLKKSPEYKKSNEERYEEQIAKLETDLRAKIGHTIKL